MASIVLAAAGASIGAGFGGTILGLSGAALGQAAGSILGTIIDARIVASFTPNQVSQGARLESLHVTSSTEGGVIPAVFGRMKVGGNIFWATDFLEKATTTTQGGSGKGGGGGKVQTTTYAYSCSFAVGLCEGPISGIGRIWADGKPFDVPGAVWRVYTGSEAQLAAVHRCQCRSGRYRRDICRSEGQEAGGMNAPLSPKQIEYWPLAQLKPYARNAKTHDANQVAKIAASMAEFGWTVPVLVAVDGELIAGHGRILAAAHLGLTEVPVIVLGQLTEAQRRAYRIADNKLTELGGWDEALLLQELQALLAEDFDLGLIGIPEDELDALLADADDRQAISDDAADAIPEPPAEPITRPGDIWALGQHRLCCGDATDVAAVAQLMKGDQATLMFTSPPYAQQRDYGAAKEKVGDWDALMQGVFAAAPVTAEAQLLVNLGLVHRDSEWQPYWEGWVEWMRKSGWRRFGWYVWDQGPGLPGDWNGRLAPSHEFIFHFNRAPRKPHKTVPSKHAGETLGGGGLRGADGTVHAKTGTGNAIQSQRIPDSVFRIMRHKGGLGAAGSHPAVFPVALVEAILTAFSDPGDLIYEPFCGSGTQLVAAERSGRRCFAMELDPVYCDVAVRRWEIATGKTAQRSSLDEAAA